MDNQLHPGMDWNATVGPPPDRDDFDLPNYQDTLRSLEIPPYPTMKTFSFPIRSTPKQGSSSFDSPISPPAPSAPSPSMQILGPAPWKQYQQDPNRPPDSPEHQLEEDKMNAHIADAMNKLDVRDVPWRFHGKSSPHHLFMTFNEFRNARNGNNFLDGLKAAQRVEYWRVPEWELVIADEGTEPIDYRIWPEEGFDQVLIEAYFEYTNFHLPLLNRLVFDRNYSSGLYKTHHDFAKVCLMVFANGARYVDDERVYWPIEEATTDEGKDRLRTDKDGTLKYSAGWIYLRALLKMGKSLMQGPKLYDFQCQVLICAFLHGSAVPHLTWLLSGVGLRSAQEIGIHVRSILLHADPTERALYNRAFWCLYHIDRINCAGIGRSVAIQDTDFDADYPIVVDDEYWDTGDSERDFKQPENAGVPKIAAFIHMLKLDHVIGAALRTIYAINKLPEHRADPPGRRAVVIELDSALNAWADAVPDGLRWDPTRADQQLFEQSAVLYSYYYYCQIFVHRPFIPTPKHADTTGLPSLAICHNASRSIVNILDTVLRRGRQFGVLPGRALNIHFMLPAWIAAVVLLITIYSSKQQTRERERALADVQRCISAMKEMELTWRQAGKLTDFLNEVAKEAQTLGDLPPQQGQKRPRQPSQISMTPVEQSSGSSDPPTPPNLFGIGPYCYPPGSKMHPRGEGNTRAANDENTQPNGSAPGLNGGDLKSYSSVPEANGGTESQSANDGDSGSLFDATMLEPFYGSLGDIAGWDFPSSAMEDENDIWAQLFSGNT